LEASQSAKSTARRRVHPHPFHLRGRELTRSGEAATPERQPGSVSMTARAAQRELPSREAVRV
jgi:hypothetical protein